jgi:hypothetical protein
VRFYSNLALRPNTVKTYASQHRSFLGICMACSVNPLTALTENHLCLVVIIYAKTHKITTVPGFVSALANFASQHNHPPLPRNKLYERVTAGLNNFYGDTNVSVPRKALTLSDLCAFYAAIDHGSFSGARDWCACLFAFFGLLRINEYTNAGLQAQHVNHTQWGISLTIPFSKTQLHKSHVDIVRRGDELCPVRAHLRYRALVPSALNTPEAAYFLASPSTPTPLTDGDFIRRVRALVKSTLKCDPAPYAGHSFRRGGTTALAMAGVPEATIAAHGRWSSLAYRMYYDVQHLSSVRQMASAALKVYTDRHPLPGLTQV